LHRIERPSPAFSFLKACWICQLWIFKKALYAFPVVGLSREEYWSQQKI
jgi:hypothetical protein